MCVCAFFFAKIPKKYNIFSLNRITSFLVVQFFCVGLVLLQSTASLDMNEYNAKLIQMNHGYCIIITVQKFKTA